jgi:hypothetical protein
VHTPTHGGDRHARTSRPGGPRYRRSRPDPHHGDAAGPSLHPALLGVAGRARRRDGFAKLEQPARAEQQPTPAGHERPVPPGRPAPSPTPRTAAATAISAAQTEPVAHTLSEYPVWRHPTQIAVMCCHATAASVVYYGHEYTNGRTSAELARA